MKVDIKNFSFSYGTRNSSLPVLDDISLTVKKGEFVCILGPSGCGKTTLLNCLLGFEKTQDGKILIDGKPIKMGQKALMVFQDALLLPWRNVLKNLTFGLEIQKVNKKLARKKAKKVLKLLNLSEFEEYYPHELSGGMKQRVNFGRALVCDPEIVLLDEPFAHLDGQTREMLQKEIHNVCIKTKKTYIFVTHEIDEALYLADRVVILHKRPGKIKKIIKVDFKKPRPLSVKYTKNFLKLKKEVWETIKNEIYI